jgi:hypothetical protein
MPTVSFSVGHHDMTEGVFLHLLPSLLERRVGRHRDRVACRVVGHALSVRILARCDGVEHVPLWDDSRARPIGRVDERRVRVPLGYALSRFSERGFGLDGEDVSFIMSYICMLSFLIRPFAATVLPRRRFDAFWLLVATTAKSRPSTMPTDDFFYHE